MMDVEIFGINPGLTHLENVGFHILNVILLFYLLQQFRFKRDLSLLIVCIFGLHPMRLESVAWACERKDVLSVFLGLLSIILFIKYVSTRKKYLYIFSLLVFALSLLAKPTLVILPLLLLLLDYFPLSRIKTISLLPCLMLLREKAPYFVLSLLSSSLTMHFQSGEGAVKSLELTDRVSIIAISYLAYLGKLFFPNESAIFYPYIDYYPGIGAGAVVALSFISLYVWQNKEKSPFLFLGWAWFIISAIPVVGFIYAGGQVFADRWTYFPHIGLLIAVVFSLENFIGRIKFLPIVCSFLVLILSIKTMTMMSIWENSKTVFANALAVNPDNFMAHTNLGSALDNEGNLAEASAHYEEAVRQSPSYPEALNNLGSARARQGRANEAIFYFQKAISVRPNFPLARYNLGLTYHGIGYYFSALIEWLNVLELDPSYYAARNSINFVLNNNYKHICEVKDYSGESKNKVYRDTLGAMINQNNSLDDNTKHKLQELVKCQS